MFARSCDARKPRHPNPPAGCGCAEDRERKARKELDALLDELETSQSRYPLPGFDRLELPPEGGNGNGNGNGQPAQADATPVRLAEPPLEAAVRGRKKKGAAVP